MSQIIKDVRCIDGFLHNVLVDIDCVNNIIGEETLVDLGINCYCSGSSGSGSGSGSGDNQSGSSGNNICINGTLVVFGTTPVYETLPGIYEGTYTDVSSGCFSTGDTVVLYTPDAPGNPSPGNYTVTTTTSVGINSTEYWFYTGSDFITDVNSPSGADFSQNAGCDPTNFIVECLSDEQLCCPGFSSNLFITFSNGTGTCSCLNGVSIELVKSGSWTGNISGVGPCESYIDINVSFYCTSGVWYLVINITNFDAEITANTTEITCSPFLANFSLDSANATGSEGGHWPCSGTFDVTITE